MNWEEIRTWRKAQRAALVSRRETVPGTKRREWNERITAQLIDGFEIPGEAVVGFCWPYRGEFDSRFAVRRWRDQGAIAALPEVVANKAPLQFRVWWPGALMRAGVYDIPVPDGTDIVFPDVAIVPMNGFDECGYRLGYGGGFFDRTLAALERRVVAVGVSFETLRLPTIFPQSHDIPMDFVVTEQGIYGAGGRPLELIAPAECRVRSARLFAARRLPHGAYANGYSSPACYASEFPGYFGEDPERKQ
ncbi:MAG: 5-formyltetrahydrofolate cyclo-ligase [Burkholderiales bacterium]